VHEAFPEGAMRNDEDADHPAPPVLKETGF
jgi:hypothetical protein